MNKHLILALVVFLGCVSSSCQNKTPKTSCLYGNNIPEDEQKGITEAGTRMVDLLVGDSIDALYAMGTDELKASQSRDQFKFAIDLFEKAFGKLDFPRLEEEYLMDSKAKEQRVWIQCNLGQEGVNDLWGMPSNRKLAALIFDVHTEMEASRVVLQLEWSGDKWLLRSMSLHPTTIKHHRYDYYVKQAVKFREQNMLHLAVLYYQTAILLSDIGLNVNEFTVRAIAEQIGQIKVDYMPLSDTQLWSVGDKTFKVYNMDTAYDNGNLLVQVSYMAESLDDYKKLDQQARDLAIFLDRKFPEYRKGFDGFRITAASQKKEEALTSYHKVILFSDLPPPDAPLAIPK